MEARRFITRPACQQPDRPEVGPAPARPDGSRGRSPSIRSARLQTLFHIPSRCRRTRPDREVNTGFHFDKGNGFASDGSSRKAEPSAPYSWYAPTDPTQRMGPYHAKPLPRNGSPSVHHTPCQPPPRPNPANRKLKSSSTLTTFPLSHNCGPSTKGTPG